MLLSCKTHLGQHAFNIFVIPADLLGGVLLAYSKSIDRIFYFATGICGISFVFSWFMGWVDIRKKPQTEDGAKRTERV